MQEFKFEIYHPPGVQHAVANYLSRMESREVGDGVRDEFPNAELFKVTAETTLDEIVADKEKWFF